MSSDDYVQAISLPVDFLGYVIPTSNQNENISIWNYIKSFLQFNTSMCDYRF